MFKPSLNTVIDPKNGPAKDSTEDSSQAPVGIWSTMLKSVGSVNSTPTGTLLILGGTPESQKLLIQRIQKNSQRNSSQRRMAQTTTPYSFPSISNSFALGYTYIEFKDQDHEDKLSHLDIYTLPEPATDTFLALLHDFFGRKIGRDSAKPLLVSILLDWDDPLKSWAKDLASWITIIKRALIGVDQLSLDNNTEKIRHLLQTYVAPTNDSDSKAHYSSVELPLEPGQYDLPLGVNLSFVTTGSERITYQDPKFQISDDAIDFIQQFLRTIALKHGSSVIYTPKSLDFENSNYMSMISEQLNLPVTTSQNQQGIEHSYPSVVTIDQIVIPAGWDSQGKIMTLRDGFNIDLVLNNWQHDIEIQNPSSEPNSSSTATNQEVYESLATDKETSSRPPTANFNKPKKFNKATRSSTHEDTKDDYYLNELGSAVKYYELEIGKLHPEEEEDDEEEDDEEEEEPEDSTYNQTAGSYRKNREKKTLFQDFMSQQYEVLEQQMKDEGPANLPKNTPLRRHKGSKEDDDLLDSSLSPAALEQRQKQFSQYNIGGIQIESSEEMFRRLKIQEAANSVQDVSVSPTFSDSSASHLSTFAKSRDGFHEDLEHMQDDEPKYSHMAPSSPENSSFLLSGNVGKYGLDINNTTNPMLRQSGSRVLSQGSAYSPLLNSKGATSLGLANAAPSLLSHHAGQTLSDSPASSIQSFSESFGNPGSSLPVNETQTNSHSEEEEKVDQFFQTMMAPN